MPPIWHSVYFSARWKRTCLQGEGSPSLSFSPLQTSLCATIAEGRLIAGRRKTPRPPHAFRHQLLTAYLLLRRHFFTANETMRAAPFHCSTGIAAQEPVIDVTAGTDAALYCCRQLVSE